MKLASYNIMSGGFDGYDHAASAPPRLSVLQDTIKQIDADIVGLIDTFRWDKQFTPKQLTQLFHYPYSFSVALHDKRLEKLGHDNGLTILSRQPFVTRQAINLGTRNAIHVQVNIGTRLASLYVVYLDDMSETTRLAQVDKLLTHITPAEPPSLSEI